MKLEIGSCSTAVLSQGSQDTDSAFIGLGLQHAIYKCIHRLGQWAHGELPHGGLRLERAGTAAQAPS